VQNSRKLALLETEKEAGRPNYFKGSIFPFTLMLNVAPRSDFIASAII
jgi:hypothetical protein